MNQQANTIVDGGATDGAWFVVYRMPGRISAYPVRWQGWLALVGFILGMTGAGLGSGWLWQLTHNISWFISFFVVLFPAGFVAFFSLVRAKGRTVTVPFIPASVMQGASLDQARAQVAAVVAAQSHLTLQAIDHVQVAIPPGGEDRARAFYKDLLGLPEQPKPPELAKRGGCWFESERVRVHLGVETPFTPARKAHIAFRVDDVPGLAARARAAGYQVVDDDDLPGHERIYVYDPFGNRLEFLKPLEK